MSERLKDGHKTLITLAGLFGVTLYETQVTPPGIDGGGENDTTTMRNDTWRTRQPKQLATLTNMSTTVSYDPASYPLILAQRGVVQAVTLTFPDKSTLVFYGWLDSFTPAAAQEGSMPTAEMTIIPSNATAAGSEVGPVYTAPPTV
jgi:hypothetical protein